MHSIYKGKIKTKTVEIITGVGGGDCGYSFNIGQDYIIYSNYKTHYYKEGKKVQKYLYTNICTRTCKSNSNEINEINKILKCKKTFK